MPSKKLEKILICPDTHAPYHDKKAWEVMIKAAKEFRPDTIIHMGDLADFYSVSSYSKDPNRINNLRDELVVVRNLRQELDNLGAKRKIFIEGNHCDRLYRYLQDKAPELFGLIGTDELLELSQNNWEFIPYRESIKIGRVYFTHDAGGSGKYTTMRALETFKHSVAIGHHHQIQYQVIGDATGERYIGAQFGWLGDINQVDYEQRAKVESTYALGFGVGYHELSSGTIFLQPCPIVDYTACVAGKIYKL